MTRIKNLSIENSSNNLEKKSNTKNQIKNHADLLKSIFKIKNSMIFYTDDAKNSKITDVVMIQFINVETKAKD